MANPRKFADKLEIIRRKEEEANAAYVQIMRECAELSDARKGSPVHAPNMHIPPHHNHHNQQTWTIGRGPNEYNVMKCSGMRQIWKGGSLPNVHSNNNNSVNNVNVNPQQNSYNALNDGFQQQQTYGGGGVVSIRHGRSMDPPSGPIFPSRNKYPHRYIVTQPYKNNLLQQPSLMEEQNESPGWRRAASDSAIQQTLGEPPKANVNGSGSSLQQSSASRLIQSPNQQTGHGDLHGLARSPPVSIRYPDATNRNNLKMQADTSSLPDLSNLSIPSPIQNPIDIEQEGKSNSKSRDTQNHFQAPYTIPSRRQQIKQQIYARQSSESDIIQTIHREQKPNLNLFPDISACSSHATVSNAAMTHSVSAPLSPVTPPPFFWNTTPISPLATTDILPQPSSAAASDLQQQLFQIHNDGVRDNGNSNPPPYNFPTDDDTYSSFCSNNYLNSKQNLYRINSGPANLSSTSKSICDHQLESALMRVKEAQGVDNGLDNALLRVKATHHHQNHPHQDELSPDDLNSVRVALHPLDFDDFKMLQDNSQVLVDQSAEEQFRLERASYN